MNSLSSIIAKLQGSFATTLVLAYLLPVLLFAFLAAPLFAPFAPSQWAKYTELFPLSFDQRTLIKLSILGASTLVLYTFNIPIIQLYEGYYWHASLVGKLLTRNHRRHCTELSQAIDDIRKLALVEGAPDEVRSFLLSDFKQLSLQRDSSYPPDLSDVLPTRLGNTVKCFEQRALLNYGFDAVVLWPHISSVADERSLELAYEAKRTFDFTLNLSFLSGLGAILAIIAGVYRPQIAVAPHIGKWMIVFLSLSIVSYVCYYLAVGRAFNWGNQVNAIIDIYRSAVLDRLGFDSRSLAVLGERDFWETVATRIVYPTNPRLTYLPPKGGSPGVITKPGPLRIEVVRCVINLANDVELEYNVRNADAQEASLVYVFDDLPVGFAILAWSFHASGNGATLMRTEPLTYRIERLSPEVTITLSCRIAPIIGWDDKKGGRS